MNKGVALIFTMRPKRGPSAVEESLESHGDARIASIHATVHTNVSLLYPAIFVSSMTPVYQGGVAREAGQD